MVAECMKCGLICLAVLRSRGNARIEMIAEKTGYSDRLIATHIEHLLDSGLIQATGDGGWKLMGIDSTKSHGC